MKDDEESLDREAKFLMMKLERFMKKEMTPSVIDDILRICKDHRRVARSRGIDFPHIIPLVLEDHMNIKLVRADADHKLIQHYARELIVETPNATPLEIARAFKRAFPKYMPNVEIDKLKVN